MVLQADARLDLPCGVAATLRHSARVCSKEDFSVARCASGTLLLIHVSYFARKSSHSSTPTFSPAGAGVVFAAVLAGAAVLGAVVGGALVVVVEVVVVVLVLAAPVVEFALSAVAHALSSSSAKVAQRPRMRDVLVLSRIAFMAWIISSLR